MPRLSVIIPAYNAEACITRSAASVLNQTFSDLELIIVNDGSRDNTAPVCAALAEGDSRVRLLHQENAGVSAARNAGVSAAAGTLIAFVDADDSVAPTAYEEMFSAMEKAGADCAACGYFDEYPDGARHSRSAPMPGGCYDFAAVGQGLIRPLLEDRLSRSLLLGTVWRYLFRRDVIVQNGIRFSGAYLEDEVFLIEYFSHPCRLAVVDRPLYGYLQNPASVTKRHLPGFIDTFLRTMEIKAALVERFQIPVSPDWRQNSAWAGLLIAVSNEFAPGNPGGGRARLREIAQMPLFSEAIRKYRPRDMARNKTLAAFCLRRRQYALLAALYTLKNHRRGSIGVS